MIMNKKAQTGPIGAIFLFMIFIVIWFVWLGSWINTVGEMMITTNNLVGVEAFFYSNLNFVVLICLILGMLGWMYFTGER